MQLSRPGHAYPRAARDESVSGTVDPLAGYAQVPVTAVIPAMNEAANLPHVLTRLPACVTEVILVDGHSTDDTVEVARQVRPDIRIVTQDGRGKGNALKCGFEAATGQIIVMLDADGSTDPGEIPAYVASLYEGAEFAKGSRFLNGGGSSDITWLRRTGNWFLSGMVNRIWDAGYTDLCYGFNAFWAHCLEHIAPDCDGFEVETLMNVRAASAGLRIVEVPSFEHDRIYGQSNLRVGRDGLRVLRTIIQEWRRGRSRDIWLADERPVEVGGAAVDVVEALPALAGVDEVL